MSEVKMYECTVLIDAGCGVTVEASSPEEAAELAENLAAEQGAGSLCHQCSSHTECGDSYAVIVYDDDKEVLDTDHRSKLLIAAQSELAALREELEKEALRTNDYCLKLTAAEQRNAVMREQLTKAAGLLEEGQRLARNDGSSLWEVVNEFLPEIKPTESGASEPACCDRFPKCVCYEGADGL